MQLKTARKGVHLQFPPLTKVYKYGKFSAVCLNVSLQPLVHNKIESSVIVILRSMEQGAVNRTIQIMTIKFIILELYALRDC